MQRSLKGEINAAWFCFQYSQSCLGPSSGIFIVRLPSWEKLKVSGKMSEEGSWPGPLPSLGGPFVLEPLDPWGLFTTHLSPGGCSITMVTRYQRHYGNKENRSWPAALLFQIQEEMKVLVHFLFFIYLFFNGHCFIFQWVFAHFSLWGPQWQIKDLVHVWTGTPSWVPKGSPFTFL